MQISKKKNISVIPSQAKYNRNIKVQNKSLRVAAYCRVSTALEQQETSYEVQISYYKEKIASNPNWKSAGIYADDGKSATNTKNRDEFKNMIDNCMAGKVDLIITKSISRFARNTIDCLKYIRMLKDRNIGVYFEKENINTLEGSGELLITILSSQAQEESRNISENTRWGVIRRFENGEVAVNHKKFMGYTRDENGELIIVPEEAKIVRLIFRLYLEGMSAYKIAQHLNSTGVKTVTGKKWYDSVVFRMLRNEKYMGDVLNQKTITIDYLEKKRVLNKGIVPQYYIEDDHEAIIPKEIYYKVQEEMARRSSISKKSADKKSLKNTEKGKYSSKYALNDIMTCKECGHSYRRQVWSKYGEKSGVWRCENRLKNGTKYCRHSPTLKEIPLQIAIMTAINKVVDNHEEFVGAFRENVIRVIGNYSTKNITTEYDKEINELQGKMLMLIEDDAKQGHTKEDLEEKYHKIAEQIHDLKIKKIKLIQERQIEKKYSDRIDEVDNCLKKVNCEIREYDDDLVRRLIQRIDVLNEDNIEILFESGIVLRQNISYFDC